MERGSAIRRTVSAMTTSPDTSPPLLRMAGIGKQYGGVRALDGLGFACRRGAMHPVFGENGAGKSTLIKIIAGVVQPTSGEMFLEERPVRFLTPAEGARPRLICAFPELSLLS